MKYNCAVFALLNTVTAQTGEDLLYAETRNTYDEDEEREFTEPMEPTGQGYDPADYEDYNEVYTTFESAEAAVGQEYDYDYDYDYGYEEEKENWEEWDEEWEEDWEDWDEYGEEWENWDEDFAALEDYWDNNGEYDPAMDASGEYDYLYEYYEDVMGEPMDEETVT